MTGDGLQKLIEDLFGSAPNPKNLDSRQSVQPILDNNRITDPSMIAEAMMLSFRYSELQELGYYHPNVGFYENIDYITQMPMLPQITSPFYGRVLSNLLTEAYSALAPPTIIPTFLSLGAGQGFLDHDLIEYATAPWIMREGHAATVRDSARFIVSDRTRNSQHLLEEQLASVVRRPDLSKRILIRRLDACDFDLRHEREIGKVPFLITYTNEVIDGMPTEPIIDVEGRLYAVRLLPYAIGHDGPGESHALSKKLGIMGILTKERAMGLIEKGRIEDLAYMPVLIPLEHDKELNPIAGRINAVRNISTPGFNGIYPVHIGLEGHFSSIMRSSEHGIVFIADYHSGDGGHNNYNKALKIFTGYRTGGADLDFHVDPEQIAEAAKHAGMDVLWITPLNQIFGAAKAMLRSPGHDFLRRNMIINNLPEGLRAQNLMNVIYTIDRGIQISDRYTCIMLAY